jgi:hypothetical protein
MKKKIWIGNTVLSRALLDLRADSIAASGHVRQNENKSARVLLQCEHADRLPDFGRGPRSHSERVEVLRHGRGIITLQRPQTPATRSTLDAERR